ncbi:NAD-dependent epimerase/dehydratase [Streptomyces sp. NPDC057474]|uniref:NAD-dependent epimerase/dehydratase n=1 Tax=Streptomyces sp. NPDC057474 TaxID=3346144 RepID=UPI0036C8099F
MTTTEDGRRPLITVLGASGFIGSAVVSALARRPVRLRLVSRRAGTPAPAGESVRARTEVVRTDLGVPGALAEAAAGSDAVIHLVAHTTGTGNWRAAGSDPSARHLNEGLVHELIDAVRAEGRPGPPPVVLFAGTAHSPGAAPPTEPYRLQKLAAERALAEATADGVLRGVTLQLTTVFGDSPGASAGAGRGVVSAMIRRALAGLPLTMWHDGGVERDLLYVRDAADAFPAALDHAAGLAGRSWAVGSGAAEPFGGVLRTIAELVSLHTGRPPVPVVTVEPPAYATAADFQHVRVDPGPFGSVTGWRPGAVLRDALDRTIRKETS